MARKYFWELFFSSYLSLMCIPWSFVFSNDPKNVIPATFWHSSTILINLQQAMVLHGLIIFKLVARCKSCFIRMVNNYLGLHIVGLVVVETTILLWRWHALLKEKVLKKSSLTLHNIFWLLINNLVFMALLSV